MARQLKVLIIPSENLCLILCIHVYSHSQLLPLVPGVLMACSGFCGSQARMRCTDTHTGKTPYPERESTAQWSTHSEDV